MPEDIIVLARLNKFSRNLFMRRSAINIWHSAMHNVPDLPPCPPDICEPRYLALVYSQNCSVSLYLLVPETQPYCLTDARPVERVGPSEWMRYFAFVYAALAVTVGMYAT